MAIAAMITAGCSGTGKTSGAGSSATQQTEDARNTAKAQDYEVTEGGLLSTNGLPMLVDFSAEWCQPCRKFKPIFHSLKEEYKGKVDFVAIDIDEMPELAEKYRINSIPTILYVSPNGEIRHYAIGYQEPDSVRAAIGRFLLPSDSGK